MSRLSGWLPPRSPAVLLLQLLLASRPVQYRAALYSAVRPDEMGIFTWSVQLFPDEFAEFNGSGAWLHDFRLLLLLRYMADASGAAGNQEVRTHHDAARR